MFGLLKMLGSEVDLKSLEGLDINLKGGVRIVHYVVEETNATDGELIYPFLKVTLRDSSGRKVRVVFQGGIDGKFRFTVAPVPVEKLD